ncbi:MAG: hypothetical protein LUD17_03225 [Bacteroidales bacterium]|nr:hypothetical protein [Bacteroidales bacterium]
MKKLLLTVLVYLYALIVDAQENYLGLPLTLEFNNQNYTLGWSDNSKSHLYAQEYFPEGQTVENFTEMFSVWLFTVDISPQDFINSKLKWLESRGEDPVYNREIYENGDARMMDFLISAWGEGTVSMVEFNVYLCIPLKVNDIDGLLVCFYTHDAEGDDIMTMLSSLKEERGKVIRAMSGYQLPEIHLTK